MLPIRNDAYRSTGQSRILAFFVVLAVIAGVYLLKSGSLSRPAPDFSLPDIYGGRVDLQSYRGKAVLLVFWTTSCSICAHEMPLLGQLEPEFRSKGVSVLAIHLGGENEAREYLSSKDINLTCLADSNGVTARAYHVGGVPKLVLIGANGRIKRASSGWTSESVLREWMDLAGS